MESASVVHLGPSGMASRTRPRPPLRVLPPRALTRLAESPGDATDGKRASKRPFLIVGLVILTGIVALVAYVMRTRGQESTDDAQVEGDVVTISVRVPGLVVAVPAEDNHRIKKGELIAQVDDTDYAARLKQAQAELAQARAQAAQAEAQEQMVGRERQGWHRRRAGSRGGLVLCRTWRATQTSRARAPRSISRRGMRGARSSISPRSKALRERQRRSAVEARRGAGRGRSRPRHASRRRAPRSARRRSSCTPRTLGCPRRRGI